MTFSLLSVDVICVYNKGGYEVWTHHQCDFLWYIIIIKRYVVKLHRQINCY